MVKSCRRDKPLQLIDYNVYCTRLQKASQAVLGRGRIYLHDLPDGDDEGLIRSSLKQNMKPAAKRVYLPGLYASSALIKLC